jgi:Uma2 family endonuclease
MTVSAQVREIVTLLMKRPITEEIASRVQAIEGYEHLEIVNGEWIGLEERAEDMTGEQHGWIEAKILNALMNYVLQHDAGRVYPGDTDFVLDGEPGDLRLKRQPDIAFVATARVRPSQGFHYGAPDLAVEIISPSQSYVEIREKINEYLHYGSQQAWLIVPQTGQIEVYLRDGTIRVYRSGNTMTGGELLPGFALDVAAVLAD